MNHPEAAPARLSSRTPRYAVPHRRQHTSRSSHQLRLQRRQSPTNERTRSDNSLPKNQAVDHENQRNTASPDPTAKSHGTMARTGVLVTVPDHRRHRQYTTIADRCVNHVVRILFLEWGPCIRKRSERHTRYVSLTSCRSSRAGVRRDGCSDGRRRLHRDPRTARFSDSGQSCVHSAHVGQECVVHYRWHAHFRRRLRVEGIEHRADGAVASVEIQPGVIVKIAAWMLDPAACAGMEIGAPRASLAALCALHDLLVAQGLRRRTTRRTGKRASGRVPSRG